MNARSLLLCLLWPTSLAWAEVQAPSTEPSPPPTALEAGAELEAVAGSHADVEAAIQAFERFLDANPEGEHSAAARFRLASLLMTQAEEAGAPPAYGPAIEQLERLALDIAEGRAQGFEHPAEALYLLGWCLRDLGPSRAAEAWQRVIAGYPGSEMATASMLQLGGQALDRQDYEAAITHFEAARDGGPDAATWAQATYMAAWIRYQLDHWDQASAGFAALLDREDPDAVELHDEALEFLALVLVKRSEQRGGVMAELDSTLALLPMEHHASLLGRAASMLDSMARFDEADALRARATRGERKRRGRGGGEADRHGPTDTLP